MAESRDSSLPGGISDIGEFLRHKKIIATHQLELKCERWALVRKGAWKSTPELFALLSQRIDPDLLWTEQRELVLPKIREVIMEECECVFPTLPFEVIDEDKDGWIRHRTESLWQEICHRRPPRSIRPLIPRYPGDKRGTRFY